jgi:hypothetical protein
MEAEHKEACLPETRGQNITRKTCTLEVVHQHVITLLIQATTVSASQGRNYSMLHSCGGDKI